VVEVLAWQAVMEAWVFLPLQSWCGGTGTGGSATGIAQQPWYLVCGMWWWQCIAVLVQMTG